MNKQIKYWQGILKLNNNLSYLWMETRQTRLDNKKKTLRKTITIWLVVSPWFVQSINMFVCVLWFFFLYVIRTCVRSSGKSCRKSNTIVVVDGSVVITFELRWKREGEKKKRTKIELYCACSHTCDVLDRCDMHSFRSILFGIVHNLTHDTSSVVPWILFEYIIQ